MKQTGIMDRIDITTEAILRKVDRAFAADLRVRINEADGTVTGFAPVTQAGAEFLLGNGGQLRGITYDEALQLAAGLTFEVSTQ
jgi:hypothetical protein